uniref:Reverse transcriptase domain-containing protein n=1 Tax=Tanacetum cinerariifolium TaxID=118510 RepID=A0A6L2J6P9_TANCI|nr:hypothetical protein [Tanacetum cinerariifolium]
MASSYEREAAYAHQAWAQSEDRSQTMKAHIKTLEVQKMLPKKTTTPMTDAVIKQLIAQGVVDALEKHKTNKNNINGDDSHESGSGERINVSTTCNNCTIAFQIKFATCTLLGSALTWWNSHVKTDGHDVADVSLCGVYL